MSSGDKKPLPDSDLAEAPLPPPPPLAIGPRGCLFYGCVFASSVALVLLLALGIGLLILYQYRGEIVERFTSREPSPIPVIELPDDELETLTQRIEGFEKSADNRDFDRLVLTEAQINGLIASKPDFRGKIAVRLEKDRIRALVSFPLEELGLPADLLGNLGGRYLNGTAIIDPALEGDVLVLSIRQLEVQGSQVPSSILDRLVANRSVTFKLDDHRGDRLAAFEISEGKLVVELRPRTTDTDSEGDKGSRDKTTDPADPRPARDPAEATDTAPL